MERDENERIESEIMDENNSIQTEENTTQGGTLMDSNKKKNWAIGLLAFLAICLLGSTLYFANLQKPVVAKDDQAIATTETTATTTPTPSDAKSFSLGTPANPADVNQGVWGDNYANGVMVGESGEVYYTQSGKKGSVVLKGKIPAGASLVLDAFMITKDKKTYQNGCLLVLVGPLDLDANPIFYRDGAAQLISTDNVQSFLDENVWVKFSRGDIKGDTYAYKAWALSNVWLPEGITFKKIDSKAVKLIDEATNAAIAAATTTSVADSTKK